MAIDASLDLRALVREVLREAIAARGAPAGGPQMVSIGCDGDLQAFIARLAAPGGIEAVRAGTVSFTLTPAAPLAGPAGGPGLAMDGVISERRLLGIAPGTTIALAAGAVVTPMAKDAARRLGLGFERIVR